jgi:tetratricopeptide (TPR) repeat protein
MIRFRSIACAVLALSIFAAPAIADAASLSARVKQATSRSQTLADGAWNNAKETALVDEIDAICDEFHAHAADGASLGTTSYALLRLMESTRGRYVKAIEAMQAEVIRLDGDLEAAQDSAAWRDREILAMRLLYRMDWVRYEIAMRYERETAKRKQLLLSARDGFSEFLNAGDRDLTIESLLGRGLTSKALREYPDAIESFRAALEQEPDREMQTRIRIPLAECLISTSDISAALAESGTLLKESSRGEARSQALFLRGKSLLLALGNPSFQGSNREAMFREAARVLEELYGRGPYWRSKVVQLVDAGIDDPAAWTDVSSGPFVSWLVADSLRRRGDCDRATPLYDALLEDGHYLHESRFGLGSCDFREARYALSVSRLGEFIDAADPADPNYANATYLRFKSAESLYLQSEGADREAAAVEYVALMEDFLEKSPDHPQTFEVWFRLGEFRRQQGEFVACAKAFSNVSGDIAFEVKGRFLGAQCHVEAVLAYGEGETPPADLVRDAIASLDAFLALTEDLAADSDADRKALVEPLEAKSTVMAAAIVAKAGVGTMADRLARLEGFESRFPDERALLPEVYSLRIVAYRSSGDLDGAGRELDRLLALEDAAAYRGGALKKLGVVFLKEASRREEQGDADGAARSRAVALRVYERLLADTETGELDTDGGSVDALQTLVEDLRRQTAAGG